MQNPPLNSGKKRYTTTEKHEQAQPSPPCSVRYLDAISFTDMLSSVGATPAEAAAACEELLSVVRVQ